MADTKKIALVTGGCRGLGKDMALALAKKGISVVITYLSRADEAAAVVKEIEGMGLKAAALPLNVGETNGFDAFVAKFKERLSTIFGRESFDFLINNAGVGLHTPFIETTEEQFDMLCDIHFKGPFFLTQKTLPLMTDGGGIVNISSGLARFSFPNASAYASMKGGIEVLTRYLAKELGGRKIRANTVAPGAIETDFGGGAVRDNAQLNQMVAAQTALGRAGLPDDIGAVVAFLCTDDAKWINAQRIEVSGGMLI